MFSLGQIQRESLSSAYHRIVSYLIRHLWQQVLRSSKKWDQGYNVRPCFSVHYTHINDFPSGSLGKFVLTVFNLHSPIHRMRLAPRREVTRTQWFDPFLTWRKPSPISSLSAMSVCAPIPTTVTAVSFWSFFLIFHLFFSQLFILFFCLTASGPPKPETLRNSGS